MSLPTDLQNHQSGWEGRVGPDLARLFASDIESLRVGGLLEKAAKPGDRFPAAPHLLGSHGQAFDLNALMAAKPVVLTFYRGGWCPYCNLELRAYQALLPEIHALGAELVAVSPELPDHSLSTAQKNDLSFTVLSDVNGALASALGIRFELSDAVRPYYEKAGHALPTRNGDGLWALPMPATFVVAKGGQIHSAFIEPDYRKRLDPQEALAALRLA